MDRDRLLRSDFLHTDKAVHPTTISLDGFLQIDYSLWIMDSFTLLVGHLMTEDLIAQDFTQSPDFLDTEHHIACA